MGDKTFVAASRFGVVTDILSVIVDAVPARGRAGEGTDLDPGLDDWVAVARRGIGCTSDVFLTVVPTGVFAGASAVFAFL